jgi:pSer/pThr/pTyr-binding forkhead associated (FHA) protein
MKLSLVVVNAGKASGQAIPIKSTQFVIGRDSTCNLRPSSAMISKKHCAVLVKDGQVFLQDFDSTNGTFLNDQPVKGEVALKNDDLVKVGPLVFKVAIETIPAPSKPTPPPKPKAKSSEEDEAAALLLSMEEGTIGSSKEVADVEIPGGSTVMDIPSFAAPDEDGKPAAKKDAAKKDDKAKHDSASQAAQALLDRMRKGARR